LFDLLNWPITKLGGFFQDNQFFLFAEQYLQPEFYIILVTAMKIAAKHYYAVIVSIEFHHGYDKNHRHHTRPSPVENLVSKS
jgi:hypothetical protein